VADSETEKPQEPNAGKEKELAINRELASEAWDQATKGISGVEAELAGFKDRFVQDIVIGMPMADLEDKLMDLLAVADWTWPWFEESYKQFGEWRMWPNVWPQLRPDDDGTTYTPDDLAEYRKAAISPLIIQTAAMIFFRNRHMGKSSEFTQWKLFHTGDAASMRASEAYKDKIKAGDMSKLPPFFPGDKTRVQADNPLKPDDDKRPEPGPDGGTPPASPAAN
jgi:hypothetical protein